MPALKLPFWIECAIRLGTRFVRVAAAAYPPASTEFGPRHKCEHDDQGAPSRQEGQGVLRYLLQGMRLRASRAHRRILLLADRRRDISIPTVRAVYSGDFDGEQNEYYDQNAQSVDALARSGQSARPARMAAGADGAPGLVPGA